MSSQGATARAAIYTRVSTAKQGEEGTSLDTHEGRARAYCAERGYAVDEGHVYRETHTGADLFERPKLAALREAIRRREVDVVVAFALDRITRDQAHLHYFLVEAEAAGVAVDFVTERLEDTPEGKLLQSVRGFVAEVERLKIRERTTRGRRARAEGGKLLVNHRPMYGYRFRDEAKGAYAIDPTTEPIVRRIFAEALAGRSNRAIAAILTAEGVPTPRGRSARWDHSSISDMLRERAYTGEARALRYRVVKAKGQKRQVVERPMEEQVALPAGTVPRLVDPAAFEAVQERLRRNKAQSVRRDRNPQVGILRRGFGFCGYCGCALRVSVNGRRTVYRSGAEKRHGCPGHSMETDLLDAAVWERVEAILTTPDVIAREIERRRESAAPDPAELADVDRRLEAIARQRANLVARLALLEDEDDAAAVATRINALAGQRRALEGEREAILARHAAWEEGARWLDGVERYRQQIAARLTTLDFAGKRVALEALGVEVRLFRSDHEPRWIVNALIPALPTGNMVSTPRCCPRTLPQPRY